MTGLRVHNSFLNFYLCISLSEGGVLSYFWRWVLHEGTWESPQIPSQAYWTGKYFIEKSVGYPCNCNVRL
jgi:hypothetical protein